MYVKALDRPWLGTPFAFQGFTVTSQLQIDEIRRVSKTVIVDREAMAPGAARADQTGPISLRGTTVYPEKTSVQKELPRARDLHAACQAEFDKMVRRVRANRALDAKALTASVSEMTGSVLRNPNAMLLLARMRARSEYEFARAVDTSVLMIAFGRFLQLSREQLDLLGLAGILLDVGKIRVPGTILDKKGILTAPEYEEAKRHVEYSADIIQRERDLPGEILGVVLQHHERQDGSGYPAGLRGAEITLYGSIASIVDTYSALVAARPYAQAMSPSNALATLYRQRGALFHDALVEQFIQCIGIYPVGSVVELNTGEIGVVIAQNLVRRLQPRVMVILDRQRQPLIPQKMLDLIKEPRATADEPYRIRRTVAADSLGIDLRDFFL